MPPPHSTGQTPAVSAGPFIGGFFGLEGPGAARGGVAAAWGLTAGMPAWSNASSALAALVAAHDPPVVWLPGHLCTWTLAAVPEARRRFFPLGPDLAPDLTALEGRLAPGDMLLAINMFGRSPGPDWRAFLAAHPDVTVIEDCAQALDTGAPPWGDWRLYSPRKLMGVPEGGLAIPISAGARAMTLSGPPAPADPQLVAQRLVPMLMRREAPSQNALWFPLQQAAEQTQIVTRHAMSDVARALLSTIDPEPMIIARKRNFARLAERLRRFALLPETAPDFAPFAFPVLLPSARRQAVRDALHAQGIFTALYWDEIAAPPDFASDHARARSLVALPCDHRYDSRAMDRLAARFLEIAA